MRILVTLLLPLLIQIVAYLIVFKAAQGGGSFMGLFALPVAMFAVPALLVHGIVAARRSGPLLGRVLVSFAIALIPPILLLIFRALES